MAHAWILRLSPQSAQTAEAPKGLRARRAIELIHDRFLDRSMASTGCGAKPLDGQQC